MKNALIILFVLSLQITCHAQDNIEQLKQRILNLEVNQEQAQENILKAHKQFSTGTMILIGGVVTTVAAILLYDKRLQNGNYDADSGILHPSPAFLYIGSGLMTIGTVIQIDSHKWIGRAGRRNKNPPL